MGKSHETFGKKERETKRKQKLRNKQDKKEQRQADSKKGKSLDEMLAYIDENGNISSTPPDRSKMRKINADDIQIGVPKQSEMQPELPRNGIITFFNDAKGYGFIRDTQSQQSVFVHANNLLSQVSEKDKVIFEIEMGPKGASAVRVKKA